jgi:hypothetical protein
MSATYPAATKVFNRRPVDRVDLVIAADVLELQDEIVTIEDALGPNVKTSNRFPAASSVANRLALSESNFDDRLGILEGSGRDASISAVRASSVTLSSGVVWQAFVMPDVIVGSEQNPFAGTTLYDPTAGRFNSIAPEPARWSLSATITWQGQATPQGRRGLRILGSDGRVFASELRDAPVTTEDDTMSVSWVGRLPADPAYYLRLQVFQDSGSGLLVRANSNSTPTRADFTHLPG